MGELKANRITLIEKQMKEVHEYPFPLHILAIEVPEWGRWRKP
jgi:hypothetical protein